MTKISSEFIHVLVKQLCFKALNNRLFFAKKEVNEKGVKDQEVRRKLVDLDWGDFYIGFRSR